MFLEYVSAPMLKNITLTAVFFFISSAFNLQLCHLKSFFTLNADEKSICNENVRNAQDKIVITDMFTRWKKNQKLCDLSRTK